MLLSIVLTLTGAHMLRNEKRYSTFLQRFASLIFVKWSFYMKATILELVSLKSNRNSRTADAAVSVPYMNRKTSQTSESDGITGTFRCCSDTTAHTGQLGLKTAIKGCILNLFSAFAVRISSGRVGASAYVLMFPLTQASC